MEYAQRTKVYYHKGQFKGNGRKKYMEAPFEQVMMPVSEDGPKELFIVPRPIFAELVSGQGWLSTGTVDEVIEMSHEGDFGYLTDDRILLGEHQMGDQSDNWMGLHDFTVL